MLITGDRPGKGFYICRICSLEIELDSDREELPFCPICHGASYIERSK